MDCNGQPTLVAQEESIRERDGRRPVIVSDVHRCWSLFKSLVVMKRGA